MDSKLFDKIKIKRRGPTGEKHEPPQRTQCAWGGCEMPGTHKAPKGGDSDGQYAFCLKHVRRYNQAFNYLARMSEAEVDQYVRTAGASVDEQQTWKMGTNKWSRDAETGDPKARKSRPHDWSGRRMHDPFNTFARSQRARTGGAEGPKPRARAQRALAEADRQALELLGIEGPPDKEAIKSAYKEMVKKHHPDANGGDKGSEERLRNIIAAYTHLKAKGFV